jgi:endonuclease YncB( thermonuclease family)
MGTLKIEGTLNLNQFWPNGHSDADTAKLLLQVTDDSFSFRKTGSAVFKKIRIFKGAAVKGKTQSFKNLISAKNEVTIRLQGIDAPELHYNLIGYKPALPKGFPALTDNQKTAIRAVNHKYRAVFGETATTELLTFLRNSFINDSINCTVKTNVDTPNEVCDTYGRIVGDVFVKINGKEQNINHWLLENGWAFPALYNSMSFQEIKAVIKAAEKGHAKKQQDIYTEFIPQKITAFNFNLLYRNPANAPILQKEKGKTMVPKLYRRYCSYSIFTKAGINLGTFINYLQQKGDKGFYFTDDFMKKANHNPQQPQELKKQFVKQLYQYIKNNTFQLMPGNLVNIEDVSTLYNAAGKPIKSWGI